MEATMGLGVCVLILVITAVIVLAVVRDLRRVR